MRLHHPGFAAALAFFALAGAQAVFAAPTANTRPVAIGASPAGEASLQDILTGGPSYPGLPVFPGSSLDVQTDQSTAAMFRTATNPGTTIPTFVAEYTANSPLQSFGIWFGSSTGSIWRRDLFTGGARAGSFAGVSVGAGTLEVIGSQNPASLSTCGEEVNCGFWTNALISPSLFGFYFKVSPGGPIYYTADSMNSGPRPERVVAYQNGSSTNWAFAYEDGSDFDYNDMVVKVESIVASVPEPSSAALMLAGLGLVGGLAVRRRARG